MREHNPRERRSPTAQDASSKPLYLRFSRSTRMGPRAKAISQCSPATVGCWSCSQRSAPHGIPRTDETPSGRTGGALRSAHKTGIDTHDACLSIWRTLSGRFGPSARFRCRGPPRKSALHRLSQRDPARRVGGNQSGCVLASSALTAGAAHDDPSDGT